MNIKLMEKMKYANKTLNYQKKINNKKKKKTK